jgi:NAD(P)-dependent dehydrogenase (short-subunit alcohol dehydrogenase family)
MKCAHGEALSGRVALVTGATGSMGAAIAQRLADEGAAVAGVGRTSDSGLRVAKQIIAGGGRACFITADVSSEDQVRDAVAAAGASVVVLDRNLDAAEAVAAEVDGTARQLVMLTRVAALELAAAGIRVNAVAPGMVVTGMNRARFDDEEFTRTWTASMPLGRVAYPVDIAKVVAFLVGPDSGWVTGQTVGTDGGVSLRVEPKIFADEQWTRSALAEVVAARAGSDETSTGTERSAAR